MNIAQLIESNPGRIVIRNQEHFDKVVAFAKSVGAEEELSSRFEWLLRNPAHRLNLGYDWAAHSFGWWWDSFEESKTKDNPPALMTGGIIYDGPGFPADGSAPQLTVSLDRAKPGEHKWGIHT